MVEKLDSRLLVVERGVDKLEGHAVEKSSYMAGYKLAEPVPISYAGSEMGSSYMRSVA
jgi:hypothetical protein